MSLLDSNQIIKKVFDDSTNSIRIEVGSGTGFSLSLNNSADSITTYPANIAGTAIVTHISSGVIILPQSCIGIKSFSIYAIPSGVTGTVTLSLDLCPSDTANVWVSSGTTLVSSTSPAIVTSPSLVARQCRVSMTGTLTAGNITVYLVGQAV